MGYKIRGLGAKRDRGYVMKEMGEVLEGNRVIRVVSGDLVRRLKGVARKETDTMKITHFD